MLRVLLSTLLVVSLGGPAQADDGRPPSGAKLFEEGRALAKQGKYAEACDKFAASLELDPAVGTQLNFADCHEHLAHHAQAYRLFSDAAEQSERQGNAERAKFARDRASALLPKLGTIVIRLPAPETAGLTVSIAGRSVRPAAEIREVVEPGDVTVEVKAEGTEPFVRHAQVEAGGTVTVDVPGTVAPRPELPARSVEQRRRSRVHLAWGLAGGGAVLLLASGAVSYKARLDYLEQEDNGNCSGDRCNAEGFAAKNSAVRLARYGGTSLAVAGAIALVAGGVIWWTAPKEFTVVPTAGVDSVGLTLSRSF